jgi:hypothetical protein
VVNEPSGNCQRADDDDERAANRGQNDPSRRPGDLGRALRGQFEPLYRSTGSLTPVTAPSYSFSTSSYFGQMLLLPTGQLLQTEMSNDIRLYTPAGTYDPAWAPAITSAPSTVRAASSYVISGSQFNGLSQGATYGDDWQSATNYPLVRITNTQSGHVFYTKTHDHSSMGVATGGLIVSTTFDLPTSIEIGPGTIEVVANGIPSPPMPVTVASNSLPGALSKTAPANGAAQQSLSVDLAWSISSGATSYEYCVDSTNDAVCSSSWTSVGASLGATVSGLAPNTTYYWQVRGVNDIGATDADSSTWWAFTTATLPGAFTKSAPANGDGSQPNSLTLSWAASSGAGSYEYCVDTTNDGACSGTWTSVATTSASIGPLTAGATYYWQVRARNTAGSIDANSGTWWSFSVAGANPPGAFSKTSPANNATKLGRSQTLSWTASSGAVSYEYCLDTTNNNGCDSGWVTAGTATSVQRNDLGPHTTYYWQVRARNSVGTTDANGSAWWKLSTK